MYFHPHDTILQGKKESVPTYPELSTLKYPHTSGVDRKFSSLMVPLVGCVSPNKLVCHASSISINFYMGMGMGILIAKSILSATKFPTLTENEGYCNK